jgi:hypothetical protein
MRLFLTMCSKAIGLTLLALLWTIPAVVHGQSKDDQLASAGTRFTVRDDGASDPSFVEFRKGLLAAARAGDRQALLKMMPPSVSASFDTAKAEPALAGFGFLDGQPWRPLVHALELGTARVDKELYAPFLYALFIEMENAAIVGRDVRMRAEPRADAPVVNVLSFEIVAVDRTHHFDSGSFYHADNPQNPAAWARVTTHDRRTGYVYGRFVWSPGNPRFSFEKIDGEWKLTGWAIGD